MLLSVVLISLGWGLKGYLSAQVLSGAVVLSLTLAFVWKLTPPAARIIKQTGPLEPEVWSFSAVAVGILFLEFIMGQVDKVALGFFRGARDVGIYSVAAAVVAYVSLLLNSVNQVFSPVIADLHARNDIAMLRRLYRALTKWILGLTLPLAITVMVFAAPILGVFGVDFESGWPILIIGTSGQLINCAVGSVGLLLLMSGNQRRLLRVQVLMACVMTLGSIVLVPVWGAIGAAFAAAITNAGTNAFNLFQVRRVLALTPSSKGYVRLIVPTLASFGIVSLLKYEAYRFHHVWIALAWSMLLGYGVFMSLTLIFGFDDDDRLVAGILSAHIRRYLWWSEGLQS
jgi:O-antigen/teichoic acid export membrane protein